VKFNLLVSLPYHIFSHLEIAYIATCDTAMPKLPPVNRWDIVNLHRLGVFKEAIYKK
jgi:hypothetical protein